MDEPAQRGLLEAELRARVASPRGPYDEAVWRLMLGAPDDGLAVIGRALPSLLDAGPASVHLAEIAFLAGDGEAARRAATAALHDGIASYVPGYRDYVGVLAALIAGDDERAVMHQAALDAYAGRHEKLGSHPAAVATLPGGLVSRDAETAAAGLEVLLAWHVRRARARSEIFNSSHAVVSLEAVVALLLAHERGLAVPVPGRYRAVDLPLLAIHVTEWDGRPLPRATPLTVVTDLVAGRWLHARGVPIDEPPTAEPRRAARSPRPESRPRASTGDEADVARQALERRAAAGGSPWQRASWALMLGDHRAAREHLETAADDARRRWLETLPQPAGPLRWFRRDQALANPNLVREHFSYALVIGDETGIQACVPQLQAWLRTQEAGVRSVYGHAHGYLDLICDLIGSDRARPEAGVLESVGGPYGGTRVAAIALANRDPGLLREGLEAILAEHARSLERKASPPSPVCDVAAHLAAAAERLAVPVALDERYAAWPVPVGGGRLPCDLLGRALRRTHG